MGFPWPRVKIWTSLETLVYSDLNAEFDNALSNNSPQNINDYSVSVGQMQTQTSPGGLGSESLPTALSGELERLRYQIAQITGNTYWYQSPTRSLATSFPELAFYLPIDGSTTDRCLQDYIRRGGIINALSWSTADIDNTVFDSTNKKFGNYAYTIASTRALAYPGWYNGPDQGTLSVWLKGIPANDYIAVNPLLGYELFLNGSGQVVHRVRKRTAATASTKSYATVTGTSNISGSSTYNHVLAKYAVNGVGGAATDQVALKLNGTSEGTPLTAQTINVNGLNGGVWFFGGKQQDPTWTNYLSMSQLPASDGWTRTGTGTDAVSDGVLTVTTTSTNTLIYERTAATVTGVDLSTMTVDFKMRAQSFGSSPEDSCRVFIRDDSMDRSLYIGIGPNGLAVDVKPSTTAPGTSPRFRMNFDSKNWNWVRVTSSGSPSPTVNIYVNGLKVGTFSNAVSDATANDTIFFGDNSSDANGTSTTDWEWFAFGPGATAPIVGGTAGGYLDEIALLTDFVSDSAVETTLATVSAKSALQKDKINGITLPPSCMGSSFTSFYMPSDAKTPLLISAIEAIQASTDGDYAVVWIDADGETSVGTSITKFNTTASLNAASIPTYVAASPTKYYHHSLSRTGLFKLGLVTLQVKAVSPNAALNAVNSILAFGAPSWTLSKGQ